MIQVLPRRQRMRGQSEPGIAEAAEDVRAACEPGIAEAAEDVRAV